MNDNRWTRRVIAALVLASVPGCDYFDEVAVPATDNEDPLAYTGVWDGDSYEKITVTGVTPFVHEVDPDAYYGFVAAGMDPGGVKRVILQRRYYTMCWFGEFLVPQWGPSLSSLFDSQSGSVGQTVMNGLYVGDIQRLRDLASCDPGGSPDSVHYQLSAYAEDFHGNTALHGWSTAWAEL